MSDTMTFTQEYDPEAPPVRCGTCCHWKPYDPKEFAIPEGVGTCGKAEMYDHGERECREAAKGWLFMVVDGSGYFAALRTRESFACNQWEHGL